MPGDGSCGIHLPPDQPGLSKAFPQIPPGFRSGRLRGEGQPNRIAPTQALLEKMEHFLNTNFPEGVDDCAFLMGKISEEVVKYAHKSDIDCIVVGAHGRIGFRQLFAGSVATEVVKKAHCSVSVIRPRY